LKAIEFNKAELITELKNSLAKYEGVKYGEEQIKEAKGDRANLNKFREALEERRKEIKGWWMKPYLKFEGDVKEVLELIDKPILEIDGQIKEYEERKKEEKKREIERAYGLHIEPYENLVPLEKIFNERWLNAGYKLQDIEREIKGIRERFEKDIEVIRGLKTEYEGQIRDKYIETLDLTAALAEKERLEEQKKMLEEVEVSKTQGLKKARTLTEGAIELQRPLASVKDTREERIYEVCFRVRATERQLSGLKTFLIGNGIEYEKIGEDLPRAARA
jgi:hypothetical protein